MKYGYVYLTENMITGEAYIGQHKVKNEKKDAAYKGSGKIIKQKFKEYGKENFVTTIIEWCDNSESLNNREEYWIHYCDAVNSPMFYNINFSVNQPGPDALKIMSDVKKGQPGRVTTLGSKWMYSEDKDPVFVPAEQQNDYLSNGYTFGRHNYSAWKNNSPKSLPKYIHIYNPTTNKSKHIYDEDELQNYLSSGWVIGKGKSFTQSKTADKLKIILSEGFEELSKNKSKRACCRYFKIGSTTYDKLLQLINSK